MPVPDRKHWESIAHQFHVKWNFPLCLGSLDGKHIVIQAPANSGSLYYNYKHTFSIVLMALVDANLRFTMIDIGSYGCNSDGGVFSHSEFGRRLVSSELQVWYHTNYLYVSVGEM